MNNETKSTGPYLVQAYRYGWVNNGSYVVALTNDREKADAMATAESEYRGGKYGCTVYGVREGAESCDDVVVLFHAPSLYGEKQPTFNHRIEAFERIGNNVARRVEGFFTEKAELPAWLKKIHDDEIAMSEMHQKMIDQVTKTQP